MDKPKLFAFVLMPFKAGFTDIYKFGIKETATAVGIHAERVDEQIYKEGHSTRGHHERRSTKEMALPSFS
jgi:hypothetical protein